MWYIICTFERELSYTLSFWSYWLSFFGPDLKFPCFVQVAILDGITMGGGAGVSVPGTFRIATDRTVWILLNWRYLAMSLFIFWTTKVTACFANIFFAFFESTSLLCLWIVKVTNELEFLLSKLTLWLLFFAFILV